jgi:hypothetical protein
LNEEEIKELEILKERRINERLGRDELDDLRDKLKRGERIDDERYCELELRVQQRNGFKLSEDELFKPTP